MTVTAPPTTARLSLTISTQQRGKSWETVYVVTNLHPDPKCAFPAWRLTKESGEAYDVALERFGPTCTCPAAIYRGGNLRVPCKHAIALMEAGLMPRGSR